jgi:lipase
MRLNVNRWGGGPGDPVVCLHGLSQRGSVFAEAGTQLARRGHTVLAPDLRGHGRSGHQPPWGTESHVDDVLSMLDELEVERVACLVGHSFGGRIAVTLAARAEGRVDRLVLLDPGLVVPANQALRAAEIARRDWSFATREGGVLALKSSDMTVDPVAGSIEEFVEVDMQRGPDGNFRFSHCPSAVVVGWSEMTVAPPVIASIPTLMVVPENPLVDGTSQRARYEESLGELLTVVTVPKGHNLLWEAPAETISAVEAFLSWPL